MAKGLNTDISTSKYHKTPKRLGSFGWKRPTENPIRPINISVGMPITSIITVADYSRIRAPFRQLASVCVSTDDLEQNLYAFHVANQYNTEYTRVQPCTDNRKDTHRMGLNSDRTSAVRAARSMEPNDRWIGRYAFSPYVYTCTCMYVRFERPLESRIWNVDGNGVRDSFLTH